MEREAWRLDCNEAASATPGRSTSSKSKSWSPSSTLATADGIQPTTHRDIRCCRFNPEEGPPWSHEANALAAALFACSAVRLRGCRLGRGECLHMKLLQDERVVKWKQAQPPSLCFEGQYRLLKLLFGVVQVDLRTHVQQPPPGGLLDRVFERSKYGADPTHDHGPAMH